ncbi:MAG: hypothetical protein K8T26_04780 [Lentisphaerae bacterium]|nr:hypothetical protein [Lentisphaerota bacterium]
MSDSIPQGEAPADVTPANRDQVLELNFVPAWARKPPGEMPFFRDRPDRPDRHDRAGGGPSRDRRTGGGGGARPGGGGGRDARGLDRARRPDAGPTRYRPAPPPPPLPIQVRFLPDDRQIAVLVKRIRSSQRAYPLTEIVSLFLGNPDACRVKLESTSPTQKLLQCKPCGMVALSRPEMENHLLREHLDEFYDVEEHIGEPPTGNFVCVAKCGLSGVLLGPPNHNLYAERVDEVYRSGYMHMTLDEYKRNIQTHHDAALIEQWKAESQKQTLYRRKGAPPETAGLRRSAAASQFLKEQADGLIKSASYASLPVALVRRSGNTGLMDTLADAWSRECRAPRNLSIAVHGALRGRHLHVFRAGAGSRFVTDIPPVPLAPERAIESIRDVLLCLRAHPGFNRTQLLAELRPGASPESPEAAAILSPLGWLVERGHIIEFFDGTLAVPLESA